MLRNAILSDREMDNEELDLLQELTQSQFRGITVTLAGSETAKVITYPTSSAAKQVLQDTLSPPVNLDRAWTDGSGGWNEITKAYKAGPIEEARVVNFVSAKLGARWDTGKMGTAARPDCATLRLFRVAGRRHLHRAHHPPQSVQASGQ